MTLIEFTLNGKPCSTAANANTRLIDLLRNQLGLTGTKEGCGVGLCGCCTVRVDGRTVSSCLMMAVAVKGCAVETIENAGNDPILQHLQTAFHTAGAVQCGYCTPGQIMGARNLLEKYPEPTDEDIRREMLGNLCRCTGYYKIIDAIRLASRLMQNADPEVEAATLRSSADAESMGALHNLRSVGRSVARSDTLKKVTGRAVYVNDMTLPGMLHGKVLRAGRPHARIVGIDVAAARAVPGVVCVLTGEDTPKIRWGFFGADQYPLAIDKVRYAGEEVAAVAATSPEAAAAAIAAIKIEYQDLPAVFDPEEAMAQGAPSVHDEVDRNIAATFKVERGDVDRAFADADLVIEESFQSAYQWHVALEPVGTLARYDPDDRLTVWTNTSGPSRSRIEIARALDMNPTDVRIIQTTVGGGFGGKSMDDNNAIICGLLARASGRPVKLMNTREDDFDAGRPRVPIKMDVRMAFRRDGTMVGKDLRVVADNGAYSGKAPAVGGVAALRHDTVYRNCNVRSELFVVYTNKVATGAFRGFGQPSAEWSVVQAIDVAAERLGLDPLDVALKNATSPGSVSAHGNRIGSCELVKCLELATSQIDWRRKRAEKRPFRGLGLGVSVHVAGKRHFYDYDGASVVVRVDQGGRIRILCGEGEVGQGAATCFAQIAAEELGVPVEWVSLSEADTDVTPFSLGAFADRLTFVAGNAVRNGAANARRKILEAAAQLLNEPVESLDLRDGRIHGASGAEYELADIVARWQFRKGGAPIVAEGAFDADSESHGADRYGSESGAFSFTAHTAEIEVDPGTGKVTILDYVMATDAGTIINPLSAKGQAHGAFMQGLGAALTEFKMLQNGVLVGNNLFHYKIPSIADCPPIRHSFVTSYEPAGPFGAKGVGEVDLDPVPATIGNAVAHAIGHRIRVLPITPEKVLAALQNVSTSDDTVAIV